MEIFYGFDSLPKFNKNQKFNITIGNFDGVHLGHQAILKRLKEKNRKSLVITFEKHSSEIFGSSKALICSQEEKINRIAKQKIDYLCILPLSKEILNLTAEKFLKKILEKIPSFCLILGENAVFGKNRDGTPEKIKKLSKKLNFNVEYLPKFLYKKIPVSSTRIREAIASGDLELAKKLLNDF